MKESTKYLRFCLVSSLLFLFSCGDIDKEETAIVKDVAPIEKKILTKEDSIFDLARRLDIEINDSSNVHLILDQIISENRRLIYVMDSLDNQVAQLEREAYKYKIRKDKRKQEELLNEILTLKDEIDRINELAEKYLPKEDETEVREKPIVPDAKSFSSLPPNNYRVRLDKYYIVSILVRPDGQVFVGQPKLDSTTVFKSGKRLDPRIQKELNQIRKKLNEND